MRGKARRERERENMKNSYIPKYDKSVKLTAVVGLKNAATKYCHFLDK
jgi:hypothetical protein